MLVILSIISSLVWADDSVGTLLKKFSESNQPQLALKTTVEGKFHSLSDSADGRSKILRSFGKEPCLALALRAGIAASDKIKVSTEFTSIKVESKLDDLMYEITYDKSCEDGEECTDRQISVNVYGVAGQDLSELYFMELEGLTCDNESLESSEEELINSLSSEDTLNGINQMFKDLRDAQ